ncbi:MAG: hypothetical protein JNL07_07350 [Rhodospirillales bacterium]|nr:hypothetical protein [Rhodospirillales bacterium]
MSAAPALSEVRCLSEALGFIEIPSADYDLWRAGNLKPGDEHRAHGTCVPIALGGCDCPGSNASGDHGARRRAVFVARRIDSCPGSVAAAVIGGTWTAMNTVYTITPSDMTFTWTNPGLGGEIAAGAIDGAAVKASWKGGRFGDGSGTGKGVTDAGRRAIRIEWSNGVVFVRK